MSTVTQTQPKVQLGTEITLDNSVWLARHKAELKAAGIKKTIGEIVDEAIERLKRQG